MTYEQKIKCIKDQRGYMTDTQIRKKISSVFGLKKTASNDLFNRIFNDKKEAAKAECPNKKSANVVFSGDKGEAESVDSKVRTLEDLLAMCQVDEELWAVERYVVNKWEVAFSDKKNEELYQVKAWLVRKKAAVDLKKILEQFVIRAESKAPIFKIPARKTLNTGRLLEISIPDVHLAKLCWPKETRFEGWDIKLSPEGYKDAAYSLLETARSGLPERILLPIGNDFFNSDNIQGTTTAGTPQSQSEDSRWQKTFETGCELLTEVIETLATEFPVDVVVVPGNHDYERCFYLGQYIKAWFKNHANVTVDNSPTQRKYYVFGQNLLGFTHGNEEKHDKLPMIMANEQKENWSKTKYREIHLGHLHQEIVKEFSGVKVRVIPSLCPPDSWHVSKGYVGSMRGAQAFLYDSEFGLVATYYYNL
jgi:predicted phosphodiesterase